MRRSIALVATAGILPIIALGGAFGVMTLRAERQAVHNGVDSGARFIATLASVRLRDGMHEVDMIAQSPAFDGPFDARRFETLGVRLQRSAANWRYLSVADPQGRRIFDVPEPIGGQTGGPVIDMESLREAVRTGRPVVGNVITGSRGLAAFAVRAPVVRDGQVRYVVSAIIPAQAAGQLLRFRALPEGWRAGILDGAANMVAMTPEEPGRIGKPGSQAGREAKRAGRPGFYETRRANGEEAIVAWHPIAGTEWSTHVSAPMTGYLTAGSRALTLLIGVVALCLALVALLVRLMTIELRQFRAREVAAVQGQRLEALGRLTGGVAHDFNNLLQPVLGGLDLLSRRVKDDEKAQRYIAQAMVSAERARTLVSRLLAFSRKQALASTPIDIAQLLAGVQDLLERSAGPDVRIVIDLPSDLPLIQADASQLELALLNLAINARDAMPGGGAIIVSAQAVDLAQADDVAPGRYVAMTVADTGEGMDEATMRQAIEPFFTTKAADKGTGLGLSMVHGFAAQSGGVLRLSSTPGVGTRATILMPLANAPRAAPQIAVPQYRGERARLILVDDDEQVRRSVAELLRDVGHEVTEAGSVDEAIAAIRQNRDIDLVITDYLMPGRNGAELIGQLETRAVPVLLITGYDMAADDVPDGVPRLTKPFRAQELLAKVEALLDEARGG